MTQISDAYNAFIQKIEDTVGKSALPVNDAYVHLPDSIDPDLNPETLLRKGFAVDFGPAAQVSQSTKIRSIQDRVFALLLIREVTTVRSNTSGIQSVKLDLIEDSETIRTAFCNDHTLGGTVADVEWLSDDGIPAYLGDKKKFFVLTVNYAVRLDIRQ